MSQLYLIATTSRSGSTHLCRLLASTGRAGQPDEYYNPRRASKFSSAAAAGAAESFFDRIAQSTATANGVCGIKLSTDAFALMRAELGARLRTLSPKFIWLKRHDVLRQAISLYRAEESGQWQREASSETKEATSPRFNAARILACRRQIEQANDQWRDYFHTNDVRPLEVFYETLAADRLRVVKEILQFLEVSRDDLPPLASPLCVMRDELTEAWARLLEEDSSECGRFRARGLHRGNQ